MRICPTLRTTRDRQRVPTNPPPPASTRQSPPANQPARTLTHQAVALQPTCPTTHPRTHLPTQPARPARDPEKHTHTYTHTRTMAPIASGNDPNRWRGLQKRCQQKTDTHTHTHIQVELWMTCVQRSQCMCVVLVHHQFGALPTRMFDVVCSVR